jgi:hypothetical protein
MAKRFSSEETDFDYNQDGITGNAADQVEAAKDTNKNRKVSPKEEREYRQASEGSVTTSKTNAEGDITTSSTKTMETRPTTNVVEDYGTNAFFAEHDDVLQLAKKAAKNKWTQEKFNKAVETDTNFGKDRTRIQQRFDIDILGNESEDIERSVASKTQSIGMRVLQAGINMSEEQIAVYAREAVRSGFSDNDIFVKIASEWRGVGKQNASTGIYDDVQTGTIGSITDQLQQNARNFGITLSPQDLELKSREALKFGANWSQYVEGQTNVFRKQAMNLYPTIREQLTDSTLSDVMSPYLNEASMLLGIRSDQVQLDDPLWLTALNGPNGPMSRDEWTRVLRTDKKYGFDGTNQARKEAADIADELRAAFAMA